MGTDILQGSHSFIDLVMNRYVVVVYFRAGLVGKFEVLDPFFYSSISENARKI